MKPYQHIFFDLDHTLWDFYRNSEETLQEMYVSFDLDKAGIHDLPLFIQLYRERNDRLWDLYRKNEVRKDNLRLERFTGTLMDFGIDDLPLANRLSEAYLDICPKKPHLLPYTLEVLDHLKSRYILHIITNGFAEVQSVKLQSSGIQHYFTEIITSEKAGCQKPHRAIFQYSMDITGAARYESILIGDSLEADIIGARNFGMDQVYFNPQQLTHTEQVTHEIGCLSELKAIL